MKYFTPTQFERVNSRDLNAAYAATQDWDDALRQYQASLTTWIDSAPTGIRKLLMKFCGHDAEIFGYSRLGDSLFCLYVISEEGDEMWMLNYKSATQPATIPHTPDVDCWSDGPRRFWLYDEVSREPGGGYRHEILQSDGSILSIPFEDVQIRSVKLDQPGAKAGKFDVTLDLTVTPRDVRAAFHLTSGNGVKTPRSKAPKPTHSAAKSSK